MQRYTTIRCLLGALVISLAGCTQINATGWWGTNSSKQPDDLEHLCIQGTESKDPELRKKAIETLQERLTDLDPPTTATITDRLVPVLQNQAQDQDVRLDAIQTLWLLAFYADVDTRGTIVDHLGVALQDQDAAIRIAIIKAFRALGYHADLATKQAIAKHLRPALQDQDQDVRIITTDTLTSLGLDQDTEDSSTGGRIPLAIQCILGLLAGAALTAIYQNY